MSNVFVKIGHGLEWFGKEVAHLVTDVPAGLSKLIELSQDGEKVASDAGNEVIALTKDVTALVAAVAKDDGASLQAIAQLITAGEGAFAAYGLDAIKDAAVLAAVSTFCKSINGTNYADVLVAIANVIADGKSLSKTVITDVEKLVADAK
jgi:hypothetical protein